ncbi:Late embryogenesis abundant protein D-29 [Vitis vinifera]|uniref:Late embryogenesis abundant protein D-29 n=1 Tax=Vitis vinifera TaxID=29760 RepID=A0A438KKN2_VITVI|nr:Late embryogenesis abundant protein D-29 [Vitis vinifera]
MHLRSGGAECSFGEGELIKNIVLLQTGDGPCSGGDGCSGAYQGLQLLPCYRGGQGPGGEAQEKAAEAEEEAKEASESWAEWAKDKISQNLRLKQEKQASDSATETADKSQDTAEEAASGAGQYSAEKADEVKKRPRKLLPESGRSKGEGGWRDREGGRGKEKVAEKAREVKEKAAQKAEEAKEKAYHKTEEAKEAAKEKGAKAEESVSWAKEKAKESFDAGKAKAGETLEKAKERIEAAKENIGGRGGDEEL